MPIVAPSDGRCEMLETIVDKISMDLRLFSNDHKPADGDKLLNFSEPKGGGYAPIAVKGWSVTRSGLPTVSTEEFIFKFSAAVGKIFGYFVTTRGKSPKVLFAERFTKGAFEVQNPGDELRLSLSASLAPAFQ